jgi:hypothetical protein
MVSRMVHDGQDGLDNTIFEDAVMQRPEVDRSGVSSKQTEREYVGLRFMSGAIVDILVPLKIRSSLALRFGHLGAEIDQERCRAVG